MRRPPVRHRAVQPELFSPPLKTPAWRALPIEIRKTTIALLARMLRDHCARPLGYLEAEEASDE